MKKDDVFPSKYLKCYDLQGRPITVTIERAPLETLKSPDGKEQDKIVLYFRGAKKALPLNVTNWDACAEICGEDTEDWPGHQIELYPDQDSNGWQNRRLHSVSVRQHSANCRSKNRQRKSQPPAERHE